MIRACDGHATGAKGGGDGRHGGAADTNEMNRLKFRRHGWGRKEWMEFPGFKFRVDEGVPSGRRSGLLGLPGYATVRPPAGLTTHFVPWVVTASLVALALHNSLD